MSLKGESGKRKELKLNEKFENVCLRGRDFFHGKYFEFFWVSESGSDFFAMRGKIARRSLEILEKV
jgi:hypothetical protein